MARKRKADPDPEEERLVEAGKARLVSKPLMWGPNSDGAMLAGGTCRDCECDVVGDWSRGQKDGIGEDALNPHREAARRSLYLAMARHTCPAKPSDTDAPVEA